MQLISWTFPKAKKIHKCNLCGRDILPGEKYERQFIRHETEGVYAWKSCKECNLIYQEIWSYVDPWDGMDEDCFSEGIQNFCKDFICPTCHNWDLECKECIEDKWAWDKECFNNIIKCLKENSLCYTKEGFGYYYLKKRDQVRKLLGE